MKNNNHLVVEAFAWDQALSMLTQLGILFVEQCVPISNKGSGKLLLKVPLPI